MSLRDDYDALRHGAGGRLVARDAVRVHGPDALEYVQGQCSQDVAALAVGDSAEALLLSPQGKLDAFVRVTRTAEDGLVLDTEGGFGPVVEARLARFKLRTKAEIELLDWTCASLRGPLVPGLSAAVPDAGGPSDAAHAVLQLPVAWGAVPGLDLLGPDAVVPDGVRVVGEAAWEALRIETGVPRMGVDLDERTIAAEAGLVERCVSFTKGCYTGQELVARLDARGNKVARQLRGLVLGDAVPADAGPDGGAGPPVPAGAELRVAGREKPVGAVTSSAWSPALGAVALAYVHRDVAPGDSVEVHGPGSPVQRAEVRALPLVG